MILLNNEESIHYSEVRKRFDFFLFFMKYAYNKIECYNIIRIQNKYKTRIFLSVTDTKINICFQHNISIFALSYILTI